MGLVPVIEHMIDSSNPTMILDNSDQKSYQSARAGNQVVPYLRY